MHVIETVILAHLGDPQSTLSSAGALYGLAIAASPKLADDAWPRINQAIRDRFSPDDAVLGLKKLDKVKAYGWRLHDAVCILTVKG